jgi:signal peptidase II
MKRWIELHPFQVGIGIAAIALALDQAWKILFLHGFDWVRTLGTQANDIRLEVLPFLDIVMVWNYGISYGLLQATTEFHRWILVFFAFGVTSFLFWWLYSVKDLRLATAIGLIIGGALGNVIDRIVYGAVADFYLLHAFGYSWYVFNIADTAVVAGVCIMGLDLLVSEYKSKVRGAKEDKT